MKKTVKASIAVGAGVILLLGGGGTLALWNDSTSLTGNTIQAGKLNVTGGGAGSWYAAKYVSSTLDTDPADYDTPVTPGAIVPGDDYIFIAPAVTLTAVGGDLDYVITGADNSVKVTEADGTTVVPSTAFADLGLTASAGPVSGTTALTPPSDSTFVTTGSTDITPNTVPVGTTVYEVTSATSTAPVAFQTYLHVKLDANATTDLEAQGYHIALGDGAVAVQQVLVAP